jgi:transcriptional regulator with XRE-family HTH domain
MEAIDLARLLHNVRTSAGLSIQQVADRSSVAVRTLYEWEAGESLNGAVAFLTALESCGVEIHVKRDVRNSAQVLLFERRRSH